MAKTSVLKAPYDADGSLMHFPTRRFLHNADPVTGEPLDHSQIWETVEVPVEHGQFRGVSLERRQARDYVGVYSEVKWRDNLPFHGALQIDHMERGRSAKYVILRPYNVPEDTRTYPMFIADLIDAAIAGVIQKGGVMSGRWMVAKRGQNYGLRLAKESE